MEVTTAKTTATITMLIPSLNTMMKYSRNVVKVQIIHLANTETISEGTVQPGLTKI